MTSPLRRFLPFAFLSLVAVLLTSGCATHIAASSTQNPPPAEPFKNFGHFEVTSITMGAPYAGQEANEKALIKIRENFDLRVNPLLAQWNAAGAKSSGRTLLIEPSIRDIKFVNATARVWSGALSGSSAVILQLKITEKETGKIIATPEFFQRAAAMGGAWTFGSTDNNMLVRITEITSQYLQANYAQAVGGPTGAKP